MIEGSKKVARFKKVSYEQFKKDWIHTFNAFTSSEERFKEIYSNIKLPKRATAGSAGYDFYAPFNYTLHSGQTLNIPTGIRCQMVDGYVLMVFPRSGLGFKYQLGICNTIPVIDEDYFYSDNEGHIFIKLVNRGDKPVDIVAGKGFAQGIFLPYGITLDDNADAVRNGGFGSTDK